MKKQLLITSIVFSSLYGNAQIKNYKVDSSFATNGLAKSEYSTLGFVVIENTALQLFDDGSMYEAGLATYYDETHGYSFIQKRKANGTLDSSFAIDGFTHAIDEQTDNSITGIYTLKGDKTYAASAGYGGNVLRHPDSLFYSQVYNGYIGLKGRDVKSSAKVNDSIIVSVSGGKTSTVLFYKDNGVGSGFNNYANSGYRDGIGSTVGSKNYMHNHKTVLVQPDGKILTAGMLGSPETTSDISGYSFFARYKSDYSLELDSTFGFNGVMRYNKSYGTTGSPYISAMALESSGNIVACSVYTDSITGEDVIHKGMRLLPNGNYKEEITLPAKAIKMLINPDGIIFTLGEDGTIYGTNPDGTPFVHFFGGSKSIDIAEFPTGASNLKGTDFSINASGDIVTTGNYTLSKSIFSYTRKYTTYLSTSSIQNLSKQIACNVYPNPSSGLFTLKSNKKGVVNIYNILGQKILSQIILDGSQQLDLSANVAGVYTAIFNFDGTKQIAKLIKQ